MLKIANIKSQRAKEVRTPKTKQKFCKMETDTDTTTDNSGLTSTAVRTSFSMKNRSPSVSSKHESDRRGTVLSSDETKAFRQTSKLSQPQIYSYRRSRSSEVRRSILSNENVGKQAPRYSVNWNNNNLGPASNIEHSRERGSQVQVALYGSKSCSEIQTCSRPKEPEITRELLYKDALYTAIHMLGKPSHRFPSTQDDIITYIQITFAKDVDEQISYMPIVTAELSPLTIVNIGIRRAEHLLAKDANGLSDPYCLISIETEKSLEKEHWKYINVGTAQHPKKLKTSKLNERPIAETRMDQLYNFVPTSIRTTIQRETLNPIWEERFQCLALRPSCDILHVEVWDHDEDDKLLTESLHHADTRRKTEALEEGANILSVNERRKYYKGRHDDFIGKAMVRIADIPVEGEEKWYHLHGKTHKDGAEACGQILMQVWLTHAYRHGIHCEDYASPRTTLAALWDFILDLEYHRQGRPKHWDGEIPIAATCLLFQYGLQTGLSENIMEIIRFNAYNKRELELHSAQMNIKQLDSTVRRLHSQTKVATGIQKSDQDEMESALLKSLQDPMRIIRNHLNEEQEKVIEALKVYRHCFSIFERLGNRNRTTNLEFELKASLRMATLEWYQKKYFEIISQAVHGVDPNAPHPPKHELELMKKTQIVTKLAEVVREVAKLLHKGAEVWNHIFWMEGNVEYMPIVYDEAQKMIVHDVERVTWSILRFYNNNDMLRKILLVSEKEEKVLSSALFHLYAETQIFVDSQKDIFLEKKLVQYDCLNSYYHWFRPSLMLWLGFAFVKGTELVEKCISMDNEMPEDSFSHISSSAVDAIGVFQKLEAFANELNWPDPAEMLIILSFIIDVISCISVKYAHFKEVKLQKEGYFDTVDQFDISERLCTSLNNIQYVLEHGLLKAPEVLKLGQCIKEYEENFGEGSPELEYRKKILVHIIENSKTEVDNCFQPIIHGIGSRVRPEIHSSLKQCLSRPAKNYLDPLFNYLEPNLVQLHNSLLPTNFLRVVKMFWVLICEELVEVSVSYPHTSTQEQINFFKGLDNLLPEVIKFLHGNDQENEAGDIQCPEFNFTVKLHSLFKMESSSLIRLYYKERAEAQLDDNYPGEFGSLQARIQYWRGKLTLVVLSAKNLLPMDNPPAIWKFLRRASPSSDPRIDIELLVKVPLPIQSTSVKWKSLNPEFDETFEWDIDEDTCKDPSSVIRLTVKDVDLISKNDFLGEAYILLNRIPGISSNISQTIPQPMNLQLSSHSNCINDNPILIVLQTRTWESSTKEFLDEEMNYRQIKLEKNNNNNSENCTRQRQLSSGFEILY